MAKVEKAAGSLWVLVFGRVVWEEQRDDRNHHKKQEKTTTKRQKDPNVAAAETQKNTLKNPFGRP